jgi:hypothetical protein
MANGNPSIYEIHIASADLSHPNIAQTNVQPTAILMDTINRRRHFDGIVKGRQCSSSNRGTKCTRSSVHQHQTQDPPPFTTLAAFWPTLVTHPALKTRKTRLQPSRRATHAKPPPISLEITHKPKGHRNSISESTQSTDHHPYTPTKSHRPQAITTHPQTKPSHPNPQYLCLPSYGTPPQTVAGPVSISHRNLRAEIELLIQNPNDLTDRKFYSFTPQKPNVPRPETAKRLVFQSFS